MKQQAIFQLALLIAIIIGINIVSAQVFQRLDLTKEKRFTLTEATRSLLSDLDDVIYVKVYLEGEFPAGFKRLRNATSEMLNEFRAYTGNNLEYEFINPLESDDPAEKKAIIKELMNQGLRPTNLIEKESGYSEKIIFPGATVTYRGRELPVMLLQEQLNKGPQETLNNSIALLEYQLANAIQKLQRPQRPKIGFLTGHGELTEPYLRDISGTLAPYYSLERFDLKDNACIPQDLWAIVVAKPTQKFGESQKYKLDQYIMNGGRVLWLIENMRAEMDSLNNKNGAFVALDYGLNLVDLLYKYGVRVNFDLVQDVVATQIPVTVGTDQFGNSRKMQLFPWKYFPVITMHNEDHPVTKNLDAVLMRFASTLDTIQTKNKRIKKTVLLNTSPYTKMAKAPMRVSINETRKMANPDRKEYNGGPKAVAVALEGQFTSLFKNRLAFSIKDMFDTTNVKLDCMTEKTISEPTKMVVISDGDLIKNDYTPINDQSSPLGYYKFTKETFANKALVLNAIEWLTDENGIIAARSKDVPLRLLDPEKVKSSKLNWQLINILIPLLVVFLFGISYTYWRHQKYANYK